MQSGHFSNRTQIVTLVLSQDILPAFDSKKKKEPLRNSSSFVVLRDGTHNAKIERLRTKILWPGKVVAVTCLK